MMVARACERCAAEGEKSMCWWQGVCSANTMQATVDEHGCLHVSSESIFELAALVHGYHIDSALVTDECLPIDVACGRHATIFRHMQCQSSLMSSSPQNSVKGKPEQQKKGRSKRAEQQQAVVALQRHVCGAIAR